MRSWHDYHLTGYRVDGERKELSLSVRDSTKSASSENVVFSGVVDYFFEHDLGTNIIYAIEESPIEPFVQENAALFMREQKWGWPRTWEGNAEQMIRHLQEHKFKLWVLSSSYGLSGWVLALQVTENAKAA